MTRLLPAETPLAPPRHDGRLGRRERGGGLLTAAVGAVLAVGVAVVEFTYRVTPFPSDQINYFEAASTFPSHPTYAGLHQFLRHGLILPIRAAQEIFGYSQAAFLVVPMLAGVALAVAVYLLGVLLLGSRTVGVAAAVLTVGNSVVFPDLTQPLPDLMATSLMAWAVVLALAIRQRRRLVTGRPWRLALALVGVGLLMGWSYLVREYIVFLWPLVPLLLVGRVRARTLVWVVVPLALIGIGEVLVNGAVFDQPFARFQASAAHGSQPSPVDDHIGHDRVWYLAQLPTILAGTPEGRWLLAALVGCVTGAFFSRKLAFLLCWALLFYVPLVALGGFLDPSEPKLRIVKERYWLPLLPAITVSAVAGLWLLVRRIASWLPFLRRYATAVAAVATIVAVAFPVTIAHQARSASDDPDNASYAANGGTGLEQFRTWLAAHPGEVTRLWAEKRTYRLVRVFAHSPLRGTPLWDGELVLWTPGQARHPGPGDYVVLYSARSTLCNECKLNAWRLLGNPLQIPRDWQRVFLSSDRMVEVYRVR